MKQLLVLGLVWVAAGLNCHAAEPRPEVAAYYFPNYHPNPQNSARYGTNWTEWELMRAAKPRFPGHAQPKALAWGYEDESRPEVMARKISTAAEHGITTFIFVWYWYGTNLFLDRELEQGFLKATNSAQLKFALMWANHEWVELFPAKTDGRREAVGSQFHAARLGMKSSPSQGLHSKSSFPFSLQPATKFSEYSTSS